MNEVTIEAKEFFTKYRTAFDKGNMDEFCMFFNEPFLSVRADGTIQSLATNKEAKDFFSKVIELWKKEGYQSFSISDFEVQALGKKSILVTFSWNMLNKDSHFIRQWRQSYNLVKEKSEWKVILSTFHR